MARGKIVKEQLPEFVTTADLADLFGLSERRINQLTEDDGVLTREEGGGYLCRKTIKAWVAHLNSEIKGNPAQRQEDLSRKARAEADSAEMAAAKESGLLMFTADARKLWENGFVKIREEISRCRELPKKTKAELSDRLKKITLEEKR